MHLGIKLKGGFELWNITRTELIRELKLLLNQLLSRTKLTPFQKID